MTFKPIDNVKALIERLTVDEEARNLIEPALADKSRLILRILKRVEQLDVGSTDGGVWSARPGVYTILSATEGIEGSFASVLHGRSRLVSGVTETVPASRKRTSQTGR